MMYKKILLLLILQLIFVACGSDEPNSPNTNKGQNLPDPDHTVTVSIYKNGKDNINGLSIGTNNYFVITNPPQWLICDVGKINGLADVNKIPYSKWQMTARAELGHGYIAFDRREGKYYALFISNVAKDELGTITGYQIKYITPFYGNDESIDFVNTALSFDYKTSGSDICYKNKSIIPFYVLSAPEWCNISLGIPFNPDECDIDGIYNLPGLNVMVDENRSSSEREGIIKLSTYFGKTAEIAVRQSGKQMPATSTILDLKREFWTDAINSCATFGESPKVVIRGNVISSDKSGNLFKEIIIRDETAAISFSVNAYNTYTHYKIGDDISVELNGMSIGRYQGKLQIGEPMYHSTLGHSISFMAYERFNQGVVFNSSGNDVNPHITTIAELNNAKSTVDGLQKWQSQFIKIENVTFEEKNVPLSTYAEYTNLYVTDSNGNRLIIRTSGYSNFYTQRTPQTPVNISGILQFYDNDWTLMLINVDSIESI